MILQYFKYCDNSCANLFPPQELKYLRKKSIQEKIKKVKKKMSLANSNPWAKELKAKKQKSVQKVNPQNSGKIRWGSF